MGNVAQLHTRGRRRGTSVTVVRVREGRETSSEHLIYPQNTIPPTALVQGRETEAPC